MQHDIQLQQIGEDVVPAKVVNEITETVSVTSALVVNSPETHVIASNAVINLDGLIKTVKEYWKLPKEAAFKLHKGIVAKESEMLRLMEEQRRAIVGRISVYLTEQDRIRQEEYRRLEAEQRAKEEAERSRLLDEAAKAEAEGSPVDAEVLLTMAEEVQSEAPPIPVAVVPQTTRTDIGTVSQRHDIEVAVTDAKAVLKAVIDGTLPIAVVAISESKIKQYVKLSGLAEIPGCTIKRVVSASFRGGR